MLTGTAKDDPQLQAAVLTGTARTVSEKTVDLADSLLFLHLIRLLLALRDHLK